MLNRVQAALADSPSTHRITRRTLLKTGVAGATALILARWLYTADESSHAVDRDAPSRALDASSRAIIAAIAPIMLAGAIPANEPAALASLVANVDRAIAGLPPATRKELYQLFALLSFAPGRVLLAGVGATWPSAAPAEIAAFLDRWQSSRFGLLRSGYGALHQLVLAGWYGDPQAWPAIGYAGPPLVGN